MLCTDPTYGQLVGMATEIDGAIQIRIAFRRFDRVAFRKYRAGSLVEEEVASLADPIAAERALRLRVSAWEAEDWVECGWAYGYCGEGLEPPAAWSIAEGDITLEEITSARSEAAASRKSRNRRNARYEKLHTAIDEGHEGLALELLEKRYPRTPYDSVFESSLELAVIRDLRRLVDRLVKMPDYLKIAAVVAAGYGRIVLLRHLVEDLKADPDCSEATGQTPLIAAARTGQDEVISYLLDRGVDADTTLLGKNAAEFAAEAGHVEIAAILFEHCDRSAEHMTKRLFEAIRDDRPHDIPALVAGGAQVGRTDEYGSTPVMAAIGEGRGQPRAVEALLDAGADLNQIDDGGLSPWMVCYWGRMGESGRRQLDEIWALLERRGASRSGKSYLDLCQAARSGDSSGAAKLLASGVAPDGGPVSPSPLRLAAKAGHVDLVRMLLGAGAGVDRREAGERTALIAAASDGHLQIVKDLCAAGADRSLEVREIAYNAADYAAMEGHEGVVEWLEQNSEASESKVGVTLRENTRDRLGWNLFRRYADIGNGEYSLIFAKAPIEAVGSALAEEIDGSMHFRSIEAEPAYVHRRAIKLFLVSLVDHPWTLVVHAMGSLSRGDFEDGLGYSESIARSKGFKILHATENDTDCESSFSLYSEGQVRRVRDPLILKELGIKLPGFDPWHDGGLEIFGLSRDQLARVDVLTRLDPS